MPLRILPIEHPEPSHRDAILSPLLAHGIAQGHTAHAEPLVLLLRDEEGREAGGLWGKTVYDWLYVELLAVAEPLRGRGSGAALLREAERIAAERGCVGAWLNTYAFQARGFYERQGYRLFGELADHPRGSARYFLMKRLDAQA